MGGFSGRQFYNNIGVTQQFKCVVSLLKNNKIFTTLVSKFKLKTQNDDKNWLSNLNKHKGTLIILSVRFRKTLETMQKQLYKY